MVFEFWGFNWDEINEAMKTIVVVLGLNHGVYSACRHHEVVVYDRVGQPLAESSMIKIPCFEGVTSEKVRAISARFPKVPICYIDASVIGFLGGEELR